MEDIRVHKKLPRMRIASECYEMIREEDPESRVSLTQIRRLAKTGAIKTVHAGNRILINYDALIDYLSDPPADNINYNTGTIRPIPQ